MVSLVFDSFKIDITVRYCNPTITFSSPANVIFNAVDPGEYSGQLSVLDTFLTPRLTNARSSDWNSLAGEMLEAGVEALSLNKKSNLCQ